MVSIKTLIVDIQIKTDDAIPPHRRIRVRSVHVHRRESLFADVARQFNFGSFHSNVRFFEEIIFQSRWSSTERYPTLIKPPSICKTIHVAWDLKIG